MQRAISILPKFVPDDVDDVPHAAWAILARALQDVGVNLRVFEHPPHGAFRGEPEVPIPHLFLVFQAETDDVLQRAVELHKEAFSALATSYDVLDAVRGLVGDIMSQLERSLALALETDTHTNPGAFR